MSTRGTYQFNSGHNHELLNVAEEIIDNNFTSCNCGDECNGTCTHSKLMLAIAKAKRDKKQNKASLEERVEALEKLYFLVSEPTEARVEAIEKYIVEKTESICKFGMLEHSKISRLFGSK
jgi:hypothetical protein